MLPKRLVLPAFASLALLLAGCGVGGIVDSIASGNGGTTGSAAPV